jgi:hypothetical protein
MRFQLDGHVLGAPWKKNAFINSSMFTPEQFRMNPGLFFYTYTQRVGKDIYKVT